LLDEKFGGEIKIHHSNNAKLIEIDIHRYSIQIKSSITCLRQHLEAKQEKRKNGLGALIRRSYSQ